MLVSSLCLKTRVSHPFNNSGAANILYNFTCAFFLRCLPRLLLIVPHILDNIVTLCPVSKASISYFAGHMWRTVDGPRYGDYVWKGVTWISSPGSGTADNRYVAKCAVTLIPDEHRLWRHKYMTWECANTTWGVSSFEWTPTIWK